jgi:hypothetical protein
MPCQAASIVSWTATLGDQQEGLIAALLTLASGGGGIDDWEPFGLAEIAGNILPTTSSMVMRPTRTRS